MSPELLQAVELQTSPAPSASIIWLHGLGADGYDFVPLVRQLESAAVAGRTLCLSARANPGGDDQPRLRDAGLVRHPRH